MKRISGIYFLAAILFVSCSKEEITSREYPRVETKDVSDITGDGVLFKGEIFYSTEKITDHGFLWTHSGWGGFAELGKAEQISFGATDKIGSFESRAEWNLEGGKTYIVRAYVQSENHIVYGNVKEFASQGCKNKPVITDFNPKEGTVGDEITIQGDFFSSVIDGNVILLGDQKAQVIQSGVKQIVVRIPAMATPGLVNLSVTSYGNKVIAAQKINLK